jgi:ABC-2 type transport system permease protein
MRHLRRVWRIARVELSQLWRSRAFVAMAAVVAGLLLTGAVVSWRAQAAFEAQRARYQQVVAAQWASQPDRHPHRVAHYGYLLFRPRGALAFVDPGVTPFTGSTVFLEAHRQNSLNYAEVEQADSPLALGGLSMAGVLQLLLPLVIFVAAAGLVAREREDGTLALLRAQGASWPALLAGKALALLLMAATVTVPGVLAAAAGLWWHRGGEVEQASGAAAALLAAAYVCYFVVCATVGVLVSAWARTTRDATLALLGLWLALWVVLPRVAPALSASAHDLPTRAEFEATVERRVRALGDSHNPTDPNFAAFRARVLARHGVSRIEDLPANYNGLVMVEGERLTTDAYRTAREEIAAILDRQAGRVALTGILSPYVAMRLASMALSGTSRLHAGDFEAQAEAFRYALVQHLNHLHAERVALADDRYGAGGAATDAPSRKRIAAEHWDDAPTFTYWTPAPWLAGREIAAGLGSLAAWLAALAALLWRGRFTVTA